MDKGIIIAVIAMACIVGAGVFMTLAIMHDHNKFYEKNPELNKYTSEELSERMLQLYQTYSCDYLQEEIREYDDYILRSPSKEMVEAEKIVCQNEG